VGKQKRTQAAQPRAKPALSTHITGKKIRTIEPANGNALQREDVRRQPLSSPRGRPHGSAGCAATARREAGCGGRGNVRNSDSASPCRGETNDNGDRCSSQTLACLGVWVSSRKTDRKPSWYHSVRTCSRPSPQDQAITSCLLSDGAAGDGEPRGRMRKGREREGREENEGKRARVGQGKRGRAELPTSELASAGSRPTRGARCAFISAIGRVLSTGKSIVPRYASLGPYNMIVSSLWFYGVASAVGRGEQQRRGKRKRVGQGK